MKIFILSADFTSESPAWINIFWPQYNAIAQSVPTVHLSMPHVVQGAGVLPKFDRWRQRRAHGKRLTNQVLAELDSDGPNILLVWALRTQDCKRAELLDSVWDRFSHHVLSVVDNIRPDHIRNHARGRYDLITSFCGDLAQEFETVTGLTSIYLPPHTDALTFHNFSSYRPIDLFNVGRRDPKVYFPIHQHFNAPEHNRFSLDFVSRTRNTHYTSEEEFRLLISTYARAKLAFCFEPSETERFHSRSPLTERWVHAWTAGCTVIGSKPHGKGVIEATDWLESMIDLPREPRAAIAAIDEYLADEESLARRRYRNVAEAMRRHDTRLRLRQILHALCLPPPEGLTTALEKLMVQSEKILARG